MSKYRNPWHGPLPSSDPFRLRVLIDSVSLSFCRFLANYVQCYVPSVRPLGHIKQPPWHCPQSLHRRPSVTSKNKQFILHELTLAGYVLRVVVTEVPRA
jgi:hypothetical protein